MVHMMWQTAGMVISPLCSGQGCTQCCKSSHLYLPLEHLKFGQRMLSLRSDGVWNLLWKVRLKSEKIAQLRLVGLTQLSWLLLLYPSEFHRGRTAAGCCLPGDNILFKHIHINHWEVVVHSCHFHLGCHTLSKWCDSVRISCACMRRSLYCYSEQSN